MPKAIVDARLDKLVFAQKNLKLEVFVQSNSFENKALNHLVEFKYGLGEKSAQSC